MITSWTIHTHKRRVCWSCVWFVLGCVHQCVHLHVMYHLTIHSVHMKWADQPAGSFWALVVVVTLESSVEFAFATIPVKTHPSVRSFFCSQFRQNRWCSCSTVCWILGNIICKLWHVMLVSVWSQTQIRQKSVSINLQHDFLQLNFGFFISLILTVYY